MQYNKLSTGVEWFYFSRYTAPDLVLSIADSLNKLLHGKLQYRKILFIRE